MLQRADNPNNDNIKNGTCYNIWPRQKRGD